MLTPEKLEQAIKDAGTSATALAKAIGRDKDYIRDYLVGRKRSLKADDLQKISMEIGDPARDLLTPVKEVDLDAEISELPVIGTIRAGVWVETYMLEHGDQGSIPVARDRRFPHARQYALAVSGDSMDQEAPDGSFVVCVDFNESGLRLKNGMIAHVERTDHGKAEATLKEVSFRNGEVILMPKSSNPIYEPIPLRGDNGIEVTVRGVVLSVYNPKMV